VKRRFALLATAMLSVAALVVVSGASAGAKTSGTPIKLMAIGPISAPGFSIASIPVGAQIAINQINASGGVNGHPLKLIQCNDENNPNTATSCARQAISDKVAAVVGGLSIYDLDIVPYLKKANIAWIGEASDDAYGHADTNMFNVGDEGITINVAIGEAAVAKGCQKVAIVLSALSPPSAAAQMTAGVKAGGHGATVVGTFTPPATNPDWASIASAVRSAGAQCIDAQTGPTETGGLIAAVDAGTPALKMFFLSGGLPSTLLTQLGSAANGVYASAGFWPETSKQGAVPYLVKESKALAPKVAFDGFTEHGYASVEVFAQAAKGLKSVTAPAILKALPKIKNFNTKLGAIISFQKPYAAGYPRLFNPNIYVYQARGGNFYLAQSKPLSVAAGIKLLPPSTT
jgi:ABC-type branched-subunit amino acid transport system substrate-binding protein